jgi:hypothetical protein
VKWEKRNEGVVDLSVCGFDFRWSVPHRTVRHIAGMLVAGGIDTEEQATDAVRGYLKDIEARGLEASDALAALDGAT